MESGDIPGAGRWCSSSTAPAKERSALPLETLKLRGTEVQSHSYRSGKETLALPDQHHLRGIWKYTVEKSQILAQYSFICRSETRNIGTVPDQHHLRDRVEKSQENATIVTGEKKRSALYQISTTWAASRRTTTTNSQETRAPAPASSRSIHRCARYKLEIHSGEKLLVISSM